MELSAADRAALLDELIALPTDEKVLRAWSEESERRLQRMQSGQEPGLTLEEFFSDDDEELDQSGQA